LSLLKRVSSLFYAPFELVLRAACAELRLGSFVFFDFLAIFSFAIEFAYSLVATLVGGGNIGAHCYGVQILVKSVAVVVGGESPESSFEAALLKIFLLHACEQVPTLPVRLMIDR
jgi:hypothetical protein